MYSKHSEAAGLRILGFPCNQFGSQEPGEADEIRDVARNVYGVEFPIFQKCDVHGPGAHPVWKFLTGDEACKI